MRLIADNPIGSLIDLEDTSSETTRIERFVKKDGSASLEVDCKYRRNNCELQSLYDANIDQFCSIFTKTWKLKETRQKQGQPYFVREIRLTDTALTVKTFFSSVYLLDYI